MKVDIKRLTSMGLLPDKMKETIAVQKIEAEVEVLLKKLAGIDIQIENLGNGSHGLARQFYNEERETVIRNIDAERRQKEYLKKKIGLH